MKDRKILKGFIDTDDGLSHVEIIYEGGAFYGVWEDNCLLKNINSMYELIQHCDNKVYSTKTDYKRNKFIPVNKYFACL